MKILNIKIEINPSVNGDKILKVFEQTIKIDDTFYIE